MPNIRVGIVTIGRNEGEKLKKCLGSLKNPNTDFSSIQPLIGSPIAASPVVDSPIVCSIKVDPIIYVDSGSTDDSPAYARSIGVEVVDLDLSIPFTAARARNSGFYRLKELAPEIAYVQFIDGDCTLDPNWLAKAIAFLEHNPGCAAVCGRRRELYLEHSIYNQLCDAEWDTPIGETEACGGDVLMRVNALDDVGGYRETLIAGEEPELCLRLREKGWHIWRIDADMTLHDAAMTKFSQWWRRVMRGGHAFAEVYDLHKNSPKMIWKKERNRALIWGAFLPLTILSLTFFHKFFALLCLIYPLQIGRLAQRFSRSDGTQQKEAWVQALFLVLAKFPETQGILRFHLFKFLNKRSKLIEYKSGSPQN